jgi:hypothetical protein
MCYLSRNQINLNTPNNQPTPSSVRQSTSLPIHTAEHNIVLSLCLDGKVTDVTGHLLDAGERRAGNLVAAEAGVDVDHDAGL